jgi:hypothetical protein
MTPVLIVKDIVEGTCSCHARGELHVVEIDGRRSLFCTSCTNRILGKDICISAIESG